MGRIELKWSPADPSSNMAFPSPNSQETAERRMFSIMEPPASNSIDNNLSISAGLKERTKGGDENGDLLDGMENNGMHCFDTTKLDLNARQENEAASGSKQFDLNGFSWT